MMKLIKLKLQEVTINNGSGGAIATATTDTTPQPAEPETTAEVTPPPAPEAPEIEVPASGWKVRLGAVIEGTAGYRGTTGAIKPDINMEDPDAEGAGELIKQAPSFGGATQSGAFGPILQVYKQKFDADGSARVPFAVYGMGEVGYQHHNLAEQGDKGNDTAGDQRYQGHGILAKGRLLFGGNWGGIGGFVRYSHDFVNQGMGSNLNFGKSSETAPPVAAPETADGTETPSNIPELPPLVGGVVPGVQSVYGEQNEDGSITVTQDGHQGLIVGGQPGAVQPRKMETIMGGLSAMVFVNPKARHRVYLAADFGVGNMKFQYATASSAQLSSAQSMMVGGEISLGVAFNMGGKVKKADAVADAEAAVDAAAMMPDDGITIPEQKFGRLPCPDLSAEKAELVNLLFQTPADNDTFVGTTAEGVTAETKPEDRFKPEVLEVLKAILADNAGAPVAAGELTEMLNTLRVEERVVPSFTGSALATDATDPTSNIADHDVVLVYGKPGAEGKVLWDISLSLANNKNIVPLKPQTILREHAKDTVLRNYKPDMLKFEVVQPAAATLALLKGVATDTSLTTIDAKVAKFTEILRTVANPGSFDPKKPSAAPTGTPRTVFKPEEIEGIVANLSTLASSLKVYQENGGKVPFIISTASREGDDARNQEYSKRRLEMVQAFLALYGLDVNGVATGEDDRFLPSSYTASGYKPDKKDYTSKDARATGDRTVQFVFDAELPATGEGQLSALDVLYKDKRNSSITLKDQVRTPFNWTALVDAATVNIDEVVVDASADPKVRKLDKKADGSLDLDVILEGDVTGLGEATLHAKDHVDNFTSHHPEYVEPAELTVEMQHNADNYFGVTNEKEIYDARQLKDKFAELAGNDKYNPAKVELTPIATLPTKLKDALGTLTTETDKRVGESKAVADLDLATLTDVAAKEAHLANITGQIASLRQIKGLVTSTLSSGRYAEDGAVLNAKIDTVLIALNEKYTALLIDLANASVATAPVAPASAPSVGFNQDKLSASVVEGLIVARDPEDKNDAGADQYNFGIITLDKPLAFNADATLTTDGKAGLEALKAYLAKNPSVKVLLQVDGADQVTRDARARTLSLALVEQINNITVEALKDDIATKKDETGIWITNLSEAFPAEAAVETPTAEGSEVPASSRSSANIDDIPAAPALLPSDIEAIIAAKITTIKDTDKYKVVADNSDYSKWSTLEDLATSLSDETGLAHNLTQIVVQEQLNDEALKAVLFTIGKVQAVIAELAKVTKGPHKDEAGILKGKLDTRLDELNTKRDEFIRYDAEAAVKADAEAARLAKAVQDGSAKYGAASVALGTSITDVAQIKSIALGSTVIDPSNIQIVGGFLIITNRVVHEDILSVSTPEEEGTLKSALVASDLTYTITLIDNTSLNVKVDVTA